MAGKAESKRKRIARYDELDDDEGQARGKRKYYQFCHKENEKERRRVIAEQFEKLREFLPPEDQRGRTRLEILSATRELLWEIWRNQEILELVRQGRAAERIAVLERDLVLKRAKRDNLRNLNEDVVSGATGPLCPEEPFIIKTDRADQREEERAPQNLQTAQMIVEEVLQEGYVEEEVGMDVYYQLQHQEMTRQLKEELHQFHTIQATLSDQDGMRLRGAAEYEADRIVRETLQLETINHSDSESNEVFITEEEPISSFKFSSSSYQNHTGVLSHEQMMHEETIDVEGSSQNRPDETAENLGLRLEFDNNETVTLDETVQEMELPQMPNFPQLSLYSHILPYHMWAPFLQQDIFGRVEPQEAGVAMPSCALGQPSPAQIEATLSAIDQLCAEDALEEQLEGRESVEVTD